MAKKLIKWAIANLKKWGVPFFAGIIFALLCFVGLNFAMEPVSKSEYCGSKCHEMNTAYQTWELSVHGANEKGIRVECVDCHLPPKDKYFTHMTAKAYAGAKDMYKHHFGEEYNGEKIRGKVMEHLENKQCQTCHDDLLKKPSDSATRLAHQQSLLNEDMPEHKCITCHENVGHERQKKLFSQ